MQFFVLDSRDPKLRSPRTYLETGRHKTICNEGAEGHILTIQASNIITYTISHPFKVDLVDFYTE